jgi:hypothetical protein
MTTWQLGATTGAESTDPTYAAPSGTQPARWTFDGGDYLEVLNATLVPQMTATDEYTIMVAFRRATLPSADETLFSNRSGSLSGPGSRIHLTSGGAFTVSASNGTQVRAAGTVTASANAWHVGWMIATAANTQARVDGTTGTTNTRPSGSQNPTLTGTRIARIGGNYHSATNLWGGQIRAVRVWQRVLTSAQMTALEAIYTAPTP